MFRLLFHSSKNKSNIYIRTYILIFAVIITCVSAVELSGHFQMPVDTINLIFELNSLFNLQEVIFLIICLEISRRIFEIFSLLVIVSFIYTCLDYLTQVMNSESFVAQIAKPRCYLIFLMHAHLLHLLSRLNSFPAVLFLLLLPPEMLLSFLILYLSMAPLWYLIFIVRPTKFHPNLCYYSNKKDYINQCDLDFD